MQKPMNKFLLNLLSDLKFKCGDCQRTMPYGAIKNHKARGECHKDVDMIDNEESIVAEFQPNAAQKS
jgi:hypothetical protein